MSMSNASSHFRRPALKRRAFLSLAAAAGGGCGPRTAAPGYRILTETEVTTLEAWCEALIPRDQDAGATDAHVVRFIDVQLARKYRKLIPAYQQALAASTRWRSSSGMRVEDMLASMEKGKAPSEHFADGGRDAFEMVLAHAMQGFYGSPRHGGNYDYASWKMLGVPISPVRGREHYAIGGGEP